MRSKIMKHSIIVLILMIGLSAHAQQDPQYTQYMYNMSVINPAYAADEDASLSIGLLYRSQWAQAVGGPTTGA